MKIQRITADSGQEFLQVSGQVNLHSSPSLLHALQQKDAVYCIDLTAIESMDSSGVATLVEGLRIARSRDAIMEIWYVPECVNNALQLANTVDLFVLRD